MAKKIEKLKSTSYNGHSELKNKINEIIGFINKEKVPTKIQDWQEVFSDDVEIEINMYDENKCVLELNFNEGPTELVLNKDGTFEFMWK